MKISFSKNSYNGNSDSLNITFCGSPEEFDGLGGLDALGAAFCDTFYALAGASHCEDENDDEDNIEFEDEEEFAFSDDEEEKNYDNIEFEWPDEPKEFDGSFSNEATKSVSDDCDDALSEDSEKPRLKVRLSKDPI